MYSVHCTLRWDEFLEQKYKHDYMKNDKKQKDKQVYMKNVKNNAGLENNLEWGSLERLENPHLA